MQRSPDDAPLSRGQLARESGVSETALKNWHEKFTPPLEGTAGPSGRITHTWAQLRAFCRVHTDLPRAQRVLAQNPHSNSSGAALTVPTDASTVHAAIADLRAAATSTLDAVVAAADREAAVATAHREQIHQLAAAIRAYDDLVTHLADAPVTPHD